MNKDEIEELHNGFMAYLNIVLFRCWNFNVVKDELHIFQLSTKKFDRLIESAKNRMVTVLHPQLVTDYMSKKACVEMTNR